MRRIWQRLVEMLVQEVPEELVACEYGCRKTECRSGDWDSCEHRKGYDSRFVDC
jgi:hypothetical protein